MGRRKIIGSLHNKLLIDGKFITQMNTVKFLGVHLDEGRVPGDTILNTFPIKLQETWAL